MKGDRICSQCGQMIPFGQTACPVCSAHHGFLWKLERETLVLISFVALAVLFVVTGFAARNYHVREKALAQDWYEKGETALKAGRPQDAVQDFRTALNYSRTNSLYELRLAQALISDGHREQAKGYLQTLWEREPGDGTINLELARLAVAQSEVSGAVRYYHNAIFGSWEASDALLHRREAHLELCRFLLQRGLKTAADAELIALEANLPEVAAIHTEVGNLFLKAQDYPHALELFQQAMDLDRKDKTARLGAGEAAFQMGRYEEARDYFQRAVVGKKPDTEGALELQVSKAILSSDPFERRLSERERVQRTLRAFNGALTRLQDCAQTRGVALPGNPLEGNLQAAYAQAMALKASVRENKLLEKPDLSVTVMDQVSSMEETSSAICGAGTPEDQALLLISRQRGASQQ